MNECLIFTVLPYLRGIEDNPTFAMYFSKQWQDTLLVSLHNFLAVVYQVSFLIFFTAFF